jgi:hypothetical protein
MLRGVILSAAQRSSEERTIRDRRNLVRIGTLPVLFDRRALNRITYCSLRSKSIAENRLQGKSSARQIVDTGRRAPAFEGDSKSSQRVEQVLYKSG